jgi:small conductance mechanosensitive channel
MQALRYRIYGIERGLFMNKLGKLLLSLFKVGCIGFGGGNALVPVIEKEVVKKHKLVLKDPAATVRVSEYADSSINIVVRAWVKTEDYWTVYFDLMEQIKARVDEAGIEVPFNQLDVHIVGGDSQNNKKKTAISKKTALKTSKK